MRGSKAVFFDEFTTGQASTRKSSQIKSNNSQPMRQTQTQAETETEIFLLTQTHWSNLERHGFCVCVDGSATAMKKHAGGVAEYRASEGKTISVASALLHPQSPILSHCPACAARNTHTLPRSLLQVAYRGPVEATVREILGGIRSTCTYVGAATLSDLPPRTTFIRVSQQLNTVFGTTDEGKVPPKPVVAAAAAAAAANASGADAEAAQDLEQESKRRRL